MMGSESALKQRHVAETESLKQQDTAAASTSASATTQQSSQQPTEATPAATEPAAAPPTSIFKSLMSSLRMVAFAYLTWQLLFQGKTSPTTAPATTTSEVGSAQAPVTLDGKILPGWAIGTKMDCHIYLTTSKELTSFSNHEMGYPGLSWHEYDLVYGGEHSINRRLKSLRIPTSESIRNNGSLFAHIFLVQSGFSPDPSQPSYHPDAVEMKTVQLTRFLPRQDKSLKKKLLSGTGKNGEETEIATDIHEEALTYQSHWYSNLTLNVVGEPVAFHKRQLTPHVRNEMRFFGMDIGEGLKTHYYPTLFVNDFWMFSDQLTPINSSVSELPLTIEIAPIALWKFHMMVEFSNSQTTMGSSKEDLEQIKRMFIETNPWFLGLTVVVTCLHSLFDFLAFKNEITFWKNRENMEGMSLRSIVINIVFQFIILLYLMDNETSWMIILSSAAGLAIEVWKVRKAIIVNVERIGWLPRISIRGALNYSKSKTEEYDELAFKYLSYVMYPLVVAYAVYSLVYESHKSWYSFILSTFVGFVYTFGFVMMTPQLFINYKLKSVAGMNTRTLTYKFLNTIIDDLFAFIIRMPTLHRLSVFRDDLIFVIYMYQRWIYPVDKTRPNEFGIVEEKETKAGGNKQVVSEEKLVMMKENAVMQHSLPNRKGADEGSSDKGDSSDDQKLS